MNNDPKPGLINTLSHWVRSLWRRLTCWKDCKGKRHQSSLSKKLLLLFFIVSVIFLLIVGGSGSHYFKYHFKERIMPHLIQYLEYVRHDIGIPADLEKAKQLADKLNIEIAIIDKRGAWTSTGKVLDLSDIEQELHHVQQGVRYGEVEIGRQEYASMHIDGTTFLFDLGSVKHHKRPRAVVPLLFLILMAFVLFRATRKLFSPVLEIQDGVKRIGAGELDHRLDIQRNDELGLLAKDINEMAAELQKMLDAKRQLLLAVSHELRSPLTRANVAIEMLEDTGLKQQIKDDIQEMEQLIADILDAERLSNHYNSLKYSQQNINELLHEVMETHFPDEPIQWLFPEPAITAVVDKSALGVLFKNLLVNAEKYRHKNITVTLGIVDEQIQLTVCDDGDGIDEQHIPYLTEPFYRVDPARQRQTGGYGLGLYLCRVIAEAHEGTIAITSHLGRGTCVEVVLPQQALQTQTPQT